MMGFVDDDDLNAEEIVADADIFEQDGPGLFDETSDAVVPPIFSATTEISATAEIGDIDILDPPLAEAVVDASSVAATQGDVEALALYRRYRPDNFAEVIGQEHVTDPLQRALDNNRVNHAYLFSGPRGCGKTTCARILARALNCAKGPTSVPCGECQSCRDLARGGPGSIDTIEIDAASYGGVDEARELRERAFFSPVSSRYKIYIIDEAHMVTPQGFNALLKLVEEPPPHVKFIFATTAPEKVLGTIRSRTHHYPFRLVPPKTLAAYLEQVCQQENVKVEKTVLPLVVRAGAGSVRDSLSVLDQLLGGADGGQVSYQQAVALLGFTPDSLLDEIVDAFAAGDSQGVFVAIDKMIEVGQDPRRLAEDLLRRLRDLIIVAAVPDALSSGLIDVAGDQAQRLTTQARGLGVGELTRAAEVIAAGLTQMRGTTAPRLNLELMCARVLLPGADVDERGIHARLERLERRLGMVEGVPQELAVAPQELAVAPQESAIVPQQPVIAKQTTQNIAKSSDDAPALTGSGANSLAPTRAISPAAVVAQVEVPASSADSVGGSTPRPAPADSSAAAIAASSAGSSSSSAGSGAVSVDPAKLTTADVRRLWPQVLEEIKGRRRFAWIVVSQNVQVEELRAGVLRLSVSSPGARNGVAGVLPIIREALRAVTLAELAVEIAGGDEAAGTSRSAAAVSKGFTETASPDDPVIDDLSSTEELFISQLGAELIDEEDD